MTMCVYMYMYIQVQYTHLKVKTFGYMKDLKLEYTETVKACQSSHDHQTLMMTSLTYC